MGKDKVIDGPFKRKETTNSTPDISVKKRKQDPQAPPGWQEFLTPDIHDRVKTAIADEGGSQVLDDPISVDETGILSETAIDLNITLPEADEEHSETPNKQITPAPKDKGN